MMQLEFDGDTYHHEHDFWRLTTQLAKVRHLMSDGVWRTLEEIHAWCGGTESACSARLRDLRKPRFGGHVIERRARGGRERGLFEYRMVSYGP